MTYGVMTESAQVIQQHVQSMQTGQLETYGIIRKTSGWTLTASSRANRHVLMALEHHVRTVLQYPNVVTVKLGRGVSRIPANRWEHAAAVDAESDAAASALRGDRRGSDDVRLGGPGVDPVCVHAVFSRGGLRGAAAGHD